MTTKPIDHHERAQETIEKLHDELATIEGYGYPSLKRRRKIAAIAGYITDAELLTAANACDANPELATAAMMTGEEFHHGLSFCTANLKLRDQLDIEAASITFAVNLKRADLAERARRVNQIAQSLNKLSDQKLAIPHADSLREVFSRPKKRRTTPAPEPPPDPPETE
jgi:hypothetical protein